jgi:hypothetical protein
MGSKANFQMICLAKALNGFRSEPWAPKQNMESINPMGPWSPLAPWAPYGSHGPLAHGAEPGTRALSYWRQISAKTRPGKNDVSHPEEQYLISFS